MLYNDLVRLNAIDQDIMRQLQGLSALYEERALIMKVPTNTVTVGDTASLESMYDILRKKWSSLGVDVPAFSTMKPKLVRATEIMAQPQDTLAPGMDIVLLPPTRILLGAMEHTPAPAIDIQSYKNLKLKPTYAWHCAVVKNTASRQAVEDLHLFLHNQPDKDDLFHELHTGAHLVAAAYLQGLTLVEKGTWNILLADMVSLHEVPCARLIDERLRFSVDDSAGFLGQNYYYPSVVIKSGKKS